MPHYDYVCEACEHEFEVYQSITASTKRKCPDCGSRDTRIVIPWGSIVVVLAVLGWFVVVGRSDRTGLCLPTS